MKRKYIWKVKENKIKVNICSIIQIISIHLQISLLFQFLILYHQIQEIKIPERDPAKRIGNENERKETREAEVNKC